MDEEFLRTLMDQYRALDAYWRKEPIDASTMFGCVHAMCEIAKTVTAYNVPEHVSGVIYTHHDQS